MYGLGQQNERGDTGRIGKIKEIQDHEVDEHTISEESREEMIMEKP